MPGITSPVITSLSRLLAGASSIYRSYPSPLVPSPVPDPSSAITMYRVARAMYDQVGLYEELSAMLYTQGIWHEALQGLRNPANRTCEFYAAKLWPGADILEALPIVTENESVRQAILQTWAWSNWASRKQVAARWLAIYGDLFIKVTGRGPQIDDDPTNPQPASQSVTPTEPRVYFQLLEPETMLDIEQDERGYLTYCRIDAPVLRRQPDGKQKAMTTVEVWDKARDSFRKWEHDKGSGQDLTQLGSPQVEESMMQKFGIDFVPIVQAKFKDAGDLRGVSSFMHAFDKINEANRSATRLHQMLFRHNDVTWALEANGVDGSGRPLPPVRQSGAASTDKNSDSQIMTIGADRFYRLPGTAQLKSIVPDLHYEEALHILQDHMLELEHDLPELAYYRLRDLGADLSGRAVKLLLSDAVDKLIEARGNAEAALVRADQMALTIGKNIGAFTGLPTDGFTSGVFDHSFEKRDVLPANGLERAQEQDMEAQAALLRHELGVPLETLQKELGYSQQEIEEMTSKLASEKQNLGATLLDQFQRGNVLGNGLNGAVAQNGALIQNGQGN